MTWKGAGGSLIFSQSRQLNFSRTVCFTNHWRGTTSRVSVTASPTFDSLVPPQQGQEVGAGITTRCRGRCSGSGRRAGFWRMWPATGVPALAVSASATISSSAAVASSSAV